MNIVPRLENELAEVRQMLMDGVQKLIDRGQKLDDLLRKTQSLQIKVNQICSLFSQIEHIE